MEHPEYELQHSTTPQPKLHDGECATRDWPMPPARTWETTWREAVVRAPRPDPAEELNPIAAAFTRLMTWSHR